MYITDENEIQALQEIISQKSFFRYKGQDRKGHCDQFEENFSKKIGSKYSLMLSSGTNALICALTNLKLVPSDEVIVPAYTFFSTIAAVVQSNATPILVNIDTTLSIDPIEVEKAISSNTRAIIAVHMDGHACNMLALKSIAATHGLVLIEDVAQACGGKFKEQHLGSIGDFGCFSFNVDKIISCGEGGAITTNSRKYYEQSLCIHDTSAQFGPTHKNSFTEIAPFIGNSMRVSEISGALMQVQLSRLDDILNGLKIRNDIIQNELREYKDIISPLNDYEGDCNTSFNLVLNDPLQARDVFLKLSAEKIQAIPILNRPGHNFTQWLPLILRERPDVKYNKVSLFPTLDLLSRCLKVNVPFDLNLEKTNKYAGKIKAVLEMYR